MKETNVNEVDTDELAYAALQLDHLLDQVDVVWPTNTRERVTQARDIIDGVLDELALPAPDTDDLRPFDTREEARGER